MKIRPRPKAEYDEDFSDEFWKSIQKYEDWFRDFEKELRERAKESYEILIEEILEVVKEDK